MTAPYTPTPEQEQLIDHDGSAFVTACPGAGKTRTMVERARVLSTESSDARGIAFLSFTNAAVVELEGRLRRFGLRQSFQFPNFIGTFDRFLMHFLITPFGVPGSKEQPRVIADKKDWEVKPYERAQPLPLSCFDRKSGNLDEQAAAEKGFNAGARNVAQYETTARRILASAQERGHIDFEDIRRIVRDRLRDHGFSARLGQALAGRFKEFIVDEVQDCNPQDLETVDWLRNAGIPVKVIGDPNQAIYGFRGGVAQELEAFLESFDTTDRLRLSGNFRSSPAICAAIVGLRSPSGRSYRDKSLGAQVKVSTPVYLLAYRGSGVFNGIGAAFTELIEPLRIPLTEAPVLASRYASAAKAVDRAALTANTNTVNLARAITDYHGASEVANRRNTLISLHKIILRTQGRIASIGEYQHYILENGLTDGRWRPHIIKIANILRHEPADETAHEWLNRARSTLAPGLETGLSINNRLASHSELPSALTPVAVASPTPRTIHSVKGMEFPAVCVVMTSNKSKDILNYLEGKPTKSDDADEQTRKIYVAASRAQRLLTIAVPRSSAKRLGSHLQKYGCNIETSEIGP